MNCNKNQKQKCNNKCYQYIYCGKGESIVLSDLNKCIDQQTELQHYKLELTVKPTDGANLLLYGLWYYKRAGEKHFGKPYIITGAGTDGGSWKLQQFNPQTSNKNLVFNDGSFEINAISESMPLRIVPPSKITVRHMGHASPFGIYSYATSVTLKRKN